MKTTTKSVEQIVGKIADRRPGAPLLMNVGTNQQREDDQFWFEQHPQRTHHARAAAPGEFPVKGLENVKSVILVKETTGRRKYPVFAPIAQLKDSDAFLSGTVAGILQKPCPSDLQETRDGWLAGCLACV